MHVEQLIRAPLGDVFSAFTQPNLLRKFWLSKASGPLELGKTIEWRFKVHGVSDSVKVLALELNRRIRVQWSNRAITEWTFTALARKQTLVVIEQTGFKGRANALIDDVAQTAEGFTLVLSDLKILLEHRLRSGIVQDKASLIERAMRTSKRKK